VNHEVELMVSLPNHHKPFDKLGFTGSLYFHPEDVDSLGERPKDKVPIVYPIENFSYGMVNSPFATIADTSCNSGSRSNSHWFVRTNDSR
jgi:hypothetical protein